MLQKKLTDELPHPSVNNKEIKRDSKVFSSYQGLHEDKLCDILQAMALVNNIEMVHQTLQTP